MKRLIAVLVLVLASVGLVHIDSVRETVVSVSVPPVEATMPTTKPHPSSSRDTAGCVNPGNPNGICWYEGYQFYRKSICIESGIYGAPLAATAAMYRVHGISVSVRFAYGQCATAGFPASQRVVFSYYTAADKAGNMKAACAYTAPANYGYLTSVYIRVNILGAYNSMDTACNNGPSDPEFLEIFAHELGHAFGLSHAQPYIDSIMRDGHTTSPQDIAYLGNLYTDNPK